MKIAKRLLETIEEDIKYKFEALNEQVEILDNVLPCTIRVNAEGIANTHFEPETEEERESIIKCVAYHMNNLKINLNNVISMGYSQMEGLLLEKVKEMNKERECEKYIKNKKGSILEKRMEYILNEQRYVLNEYESTIFKCVNDLLRPHRNKVTHNTYAMYNFEDAEKLIGDGVNIEAKIYGFHELYVQSADTVYTTVKDFFELCEKI